MLPEHVLPPYPTWQRHLKPLSVSKQVPPFWQVSVWHGLLSVEEILTWATTNRNGYILWKRDRLTKSGDYLFAVLDTENDYFHLLSNLYITALPDIAVTGQLPNIFSCLIFPAKLICIIIAVTLCITVTLPFPKGDRCTQVWPAVPAWPIQAFRLWRWCIKMWVEKTANGLRVKVS